MAQEVGGCRNLLGDCAGMSVLFNSSLGENICVPIFSVGAVADDMDDQEDGRPNKQASANPCYIACKTLISRS